MVREGDAALTAAVALAGADLRQMRPGDVLNLLDQIKPLAPGPALFLRDVKPEPIHPGPPPFVPRPIPVGGHPDVEVVRDWLAGLQKGIRRLLRQIAEVRGGSGQKIPFKGVVALRPPDEGRPTFNEFQISYEPTGGDHKDKFVNAIILEIVTRLAGADLDRLRQCPVCKRWFWAGRRLDQVYDSQACLMRARWQRDRKKR